MSTIRETFYLTEPADGRCARYRDTCDLRLVSEANAGDHDAFEELCRRYSNKLKRYIRRIVRDQSDTDDVLQETLLSAFIHLKSFEGRSSVSTWLTRIAINAALTNLRRTRRVAVPIEEMAEDTRRGQVYVLRDRAPDPERQLIQKQKERLLRQAIVRLPRRLRRVVELRVKHGYSGRQIAEDLGISESAAKSRLLRAHLRLCSRETARVNAIRQGNVRNCGMSRV